TSALEIREVLRVGTEEIQVLDAGRMHGGDIQKSHIRVHPRLGVDIATLAHDFITIRALAVIELVAREHLREIRVDEALLSISLALENDLRSVSLRGGVDRETAQVRQNLTSRVVVLTSLESRLGALHVVGTVVRDLEPLVFRNRLIPVVVVLDVRQTKLDLELLQRLLLARVLVNIGMRSIVSLAEERIRNVRDDLLAESV